MTVDEMLDRISSSELIEWAAFAAIEPFGGAAEDYRAGVGPAITANANRDKKTSAAIHPLDFYPWHEPKAAPTNEPLVLSPEQEAAAVARLLEPGKHG